MKFEPNLSNALRVFYVVVGLILIVSSFAMSMEGWIRVVVLILGVLTVGAGATGW